VYWSVGGDLGFVILGQNYCEKGPNTALQWKICLATDDPMLLLMYSD
jgi:hypothetical protein